VSINKIFLILCLLTITTGTQAQIKTLQATPTNIAPLLDGILMPDEWNTADSATQFIQMEPAKGEPATESTIVYCLCDQNNLYFGFKCYERHPKNLVANIQRRDALEKSDDAVFIILDTYLDHRSGFAFFTNPIGTQTDIRIGDDGRNLDQNWDTKWQVAVMKTSWGWSAEFAIPFSSIRFDAALDTWGINFGRIIRKNSETVYWSGLMNDDFRISQGGRLTHLQIAPKKTLFTLTPYATVRFEDSDLTGHHRQWFDDYGIDAAYPLTSSLTANVTVNPDFATVEGDQERINFTRWELDFPEKRLFFLEGNELYKTRIQTFYSRRIGEIDYGGKLTGKIKDYTLSILSVHSPADDRQNNPAANFSVIRVKKDILKSSTIGMTLIDKNQAGGYTRSLSTDFVLNPGKTWKITGQFVSSAPAAGDFLKYCAYFIRVANESNLHHYHIRYSDTGQRFRDNVNQTGYIRDDDMREIDTDFKYTWWLDRWFLKYIHFLSKNNIFWNHAGTLRSWFLTDQIRFYFQNRLSLDFFYNDEFKLYEQKFYNHQYNLELGYNTDEWAGAWIDYRWGRNYEREFALWETGLRCSPFQNFTLNYEFKYLKYSPDPTEKSTTINIVTVDYNFTRDLWMRVLAQNNTHIDRIYLYGLFAWRFQPPFGAVYLIYTADAEEYPRSSDREENRIFFVKFSYQFSL